MSIEAAIAENTSAIKELIGVWAKLLAQGKSINARVESGEVEAVTAGTERIPVAKAKVEAPKPVPTPPASVTATAPSEAATESPSEIEYATVAQAINDAVKADRPRAIAVLAKFGAKKGPDLKPEQYAEFLKELA